MQSITNPSTKNIIIIGLIGTGDAFLAGDIYKENLPLYQATSFIVVMSVIFMLGYYNGRIVRKQSCVLILATVFMLLAMSYVVLDAASVNVPYGRIDRWQASVIELYNNPPGAGEQFGLPVPYIGCWDNGVNDGCIDYKNCVIEWATGGSLTVRCYGSGTVAGYKITNDIGRGFQIHGLPDNPDPYIERLW